MNDVSPAANCYIPAEFYLEVQSRLQTASPHTYALLSIDLDNFKYINDLFGYEFGDQILELATMHFSDHLEAGELFSRINADNFVFLIRAMEKDAMLERLLHLANVEKCLAPFFPAHYNFVTSGGIFPIQDRSEKLATMLDKANFARKKAKGNHMSTFLYYTQEMSDELQWKKEITLSMELALKEHEFEMYLQPKILIKNGGVIGAEALVRWNSQKNGMIHPDHFIPVLEQNGFIKLLDFYMLEQVCLFLKKCMAENLPVLPISVNFSKVHIGTPDFVNKVFETVQHHQISTNLIEIELTESVFSRDFQALVQIATGLKHLGFKVSLDDFGSAYSSLNYLKDFPVDIIKIDKGFLNASTNTDKGRLIIAKIVEMVKSLRLMTVMEGVEEQEQVEFLQKLNCDIGQGYFYAKPMTPVNYEKFMKTHITLPGHKINHEEELEDNSAKELERTILLQNTLQDKINALETLYTNIPGGLIHCSTDKDFTLLYHNDEFLRLTGYSKQDLSALFDNKLLNLITPEDRENVRISINEQLKNDNHAKIEFRIKNKKEKILWVLGQGQRIINQKGYDRFCCVLIDITAEKESREALHCREERYKIIIDQSDAIIFEWDFSTNTITFSDKYEKILGLAPIIAEVIDSEEMFKRIHPDDESTLRDWIKNTYKKTLTSNFEFRFRTAENNYIWMRSRSSVICAQDGTPIKAIGAFNNIDHQKATINYLKQKSQQDSLTKLYNKEEARHAIEKCLSASVPDEKSAMIIVDIDNFKGINDHLGHQFGDTVLVEMAQKIKMLFRDSDIVGRLGGDEFVIFMRGLTNETAVYEKADTLTRVLRNTYFGETKKYKVSGSIGIAYCPQHATDFKTLYKLADIALYQSKNKGKDCYTIYHDDMTDAQTEVRTPLESSERFVASYFEDDPIYNIFEMLYETKDMHTTIHMILALVGKRFQVDRAYIFEHSDDGKLSSNTYEWCADGIAPEIDTLQNIATSDLDDFLSAYNKDGMFYCNDIEALDPFSFETLNRQGIKSFLHCAIFNEGERKGFIGFDDCKQQRIWRSEEIATLNYISRILSIFILKKQISKELWNSYQNHTEMLDNLNGYVYVIDTKTFETLYLNKAMKALNAKVGEKCHKIAYGSDIPCENCPARQLSPQTPSASEEFYSIKINTWVNSAASRLKWTGNKEAALVCCTNITKYKQDCS